MSDLTPGHLFIAGLLAAGIAGAAGLLRLLSFSGVLAAFGVGFFVFGFGGGPFAVPLLAFFLSSSLLSRVGRARKARLEAVYAKTATRDAWQVLANGSVPAALAAAYALHGEPRLWMLALAALAAVNADTWATEIGSLARGCPRLVTTMRPVEPGTSGAVSPLGLLAALLGSGFVTLAGWLAWPPHSLLLLWRFSLAEMLAIAWAGFVAAFADSILGASAQAQGRCVRCGALVERAEHCGQPTRHARGLRRLTNDAVNFLTALLGALFAALLLSVVARQG